MRVALGFRAHSGWAAMVAVAGTVDAPRVLDRRKIVIADPELAGSKQPYHAAAEIALAEAEVRIRQAIESSQGLAAEAIEVAIRALEREGHEVCGCAVLFGSGKPLPPLEAILASHALIHTAEGVMFREAIVWAAKQWKFPVSGIREKDLDPEWLTRVSSLGKLMGPPWTQDQKFATVAALKLLETSARPDRLI
jgi:hypothetical protein